jgi:hypothetical protein
VTKFYELLFNMLNEDGVDEYDEHDPFLNHFYKRWWKDIKNGNNLCVRVLSAVCFEGNAESMVGKGIIYAKLQFFYNGNRPRFDFVLVATTDGVELAQVFTLIELTDERKNRRIYAYVAWMYNEEIDANKSDIKYGRGSAPKYFERYKYGVDPKYKGGAFKCQIDLIESSSIMGSAYVVPDFQCTESFSVKPSRTDRFFLVDRKFTDRSDWVNSVIIGPVLPDDVDEYLQRMAIDRPNPGDEQEIEEEAARPPAQRRRRAYDVDDFDVDVGLNDMNNYYGHYDDEVFDDD